MNFTQRLRQNQLLVGSMLTIPSPEVAEMMSKCDLDWLFMDGEHSPLSILDWQRMIQAVAGRCACILRVPCSSEVDIKKALDIGADGIIAPQVKNAEQARQIVRWCKYPPAGERGVGLARAQCYGLEFSEYLATANDSLAVIVQVEHIDAVAKIDEIAAVEGLDAVFIGPYDLSASMNLTGEVDHPEVKAAIEKVRQACQSRKLALGYFGVSVESVQSSIALGYHLICAGVDAAFVTRGASEISQGLKR